MRFQRAERIVASKQSISTGCYTVGANNLTSTDGTYNYLYDDEGNRTRRTLISNGSYEEYTWDYRNRLTAVTFKNSGGTVLKTVAYEYDAFNRLVRRTYDADGPGGGAAADQFFAFDNGINPLLEFDANTAADVSHRYLWGPQVDQLFADEQVTSTGSAGNILWALGNNLDTPLDIVDLSGGTASIVNHRRQSAYGAIVSETNSAVDLAFANTGKFYDEVTGLLLHLNRWYDPNLGQWLSEDPKRLEPDANARRYVGNSVGTRVDSNGLDWRSAVKWLVPTYGIPNSPNHGIQAGIDIVFDYIQVRQNGGSVPAAIGTAIAGPTGVRELSDAWSEHDAVDGHRQTPAEKVEDGISGALKLASIGFGGARIITGAVPGIRTRVDLHIQLREGGYTHHGTTRGGYVRYRHSNGSDVWVRPNGEVVRTGPKVTPVDGGKAYNPRVDANGNRIDTHNPGEFVTPLPGH